MLSSEKCCELRIFKFFSFNFFEIIVNSIARFLCPQLVPFKKDTYVCVGFKFVNSPPPSSLVPLFENESPCKTFFVKMSLICKKINL